MIRTGWSAGLTAVLATVLATVLALAAHPAAATNACTGSAAPLQIIPGLVRLPAGVVGKAYRHQLHATGGVPPYTYYAQTLPPGFTLSTDGILQGKASPLPLLTLFTVRVCDKNGGVAQQTFRLAIVPPWHPPKPKPKPKPSPKPKPAPQPAPKPSPKPEKPEPAVQSMVVYKLTPAILKKLKPKANSSASAASTQGGTTGPSAEEAAGVNPEDFLPAVDPGADGAAGQAASTTKSSATSAAKPSSTSTAKSSATSSPKSSAASATKPSTSSTANPSTSRATPPALAAGVLKKVKAALKPLEGVEYPGRELFGAALTARLCRALEKSAGGSDPVQRKPASAAPETVCPSQESGSAVKGRTATKGAQSAQKKTASSPLPALLDWLVEQAGVRHEFPLTSAPRWSGAGCGCVHPEATSWMPGQSGGTIMGFYPLWQATKQVQKPDFNMFARISVFALTFDGKGDLVTPKWTTSEWTFVRQAHLHHTRVDFTLYRNHWAFLEGSDRHLIATALAQQAVGFIDRPVPGLAARSHRWLPGFAVTERLGDGLTLYFQRPPTQSETLLKNFHSFTDTLIHALIKTFRQRGGHYTLNIVMRENAIGASMSAWPIESLAKYISLAGGATALNGSNAPEGSCYGQASVKVCYLVLLGEPLERSARNLRDYIETTPGVTQEQRRLIRSSVIPVIPTGSVKGEQLGTQLGHFTDWFAGAGFWPVFGRDSEADKDVSGQLQEGFSYPGPSVGRSIATRVCEYRWPLRAAFEGLLLLWLIGAVAYKSSCRVQKLGLRYLLGLLIGAVVVVLLGAVLLTWDPDLTGLRQGNALLAALLIAIIAVAGYQLFKAKMRVEKP